MMRWSYVLHNFRCVLVDGLRVEVKLKAIRKSRALKALAVHSSAALLLDKSAAKHATIARTLGPEIARLFTDKAIEQSLRRLLKMLFQCSTLHEMQVLVDDPDEALAPLPDEFANIMAIFDDAFPKKQDNRTSNADDVRSNTDKSEVGGGETSTIATDTMTSSKDTPTDNTFDKKRDKNDNPMREQNRGLFFFSILLQ